jgi:hypothetical protein
VKSPYEPPGQQRRVGNKEDQEQCRKDNEERSSPKIAGYFHRGRIL